MAQDTNTVEKVAFTGWDGVGAAIQKVTSSQLENFDPNTIANAFDVVSACESRTKLPSGVKKGYWTTVCLWWEGFELEVFDDRVEVYRFRDKGMDIWEEAHTPGGSFTQQFLDELATLAPA
jgi:hypothetical protein